jgi:hypothetical protein
VRREREKREDKLQQFMLFCPYLIEVFSMFYINVILGRVGGE